MRDTYRILVTGSRDWADRALLSFELGIAIGECHRPLSDVVIVHGDCPSGADRMARNIAFSYGYKTDPHPADWGLYGRAAGFRRNAEMVALGADLCLVFAMPCADVRCTRPRPHDSHGASDCAERAAKAGIPVRRFTALPVDLA